MIKIKVRDESDKILTEEVNKHIVKKFAKLDKYIKNSDNYEARVILKERDKQVVMEVTIALKNDITLRIKEKDRNVYSVINSSVDKLIRQIRKEKTKVVSRKDKSKKEDE